MAEDRVVEADLGLIQAEAVLAELEASPGVTPCNAPLVLAFAQLRG